ncbi:DUF624 domain-containing protein [Neobacillus vireti]|uniref:DUF624 domain-containing protein n=1 Tax=Neobacillus vireti TaxID=220686 RepID=UPI002FFE4167
MNETNYLQFFDGKLFKVMNYIYWIFMTSTLFLLTNILLIFSTYALVMASKEMPISIFHLIIIGIFTIPVGPSLAAMYDVMNKIIQNQEVSVIKDFFKGYRRHFRQSVGLSCILVFLTIITVMNYFILQQSQDMGFMLLPLLAVISLIMCVSLYTFQFVSLKKFTMKEIGKLSLYFSIKEFKTTIMMLISAALCIYLMLLIPTVTIFLFPGIYCFVSTFLLQKVNKKIVSSTI